MVPARGRLVIGPVEARHIAAQTLLRKRTTWAVQTPDPPAARIALQPPSEREAMADQTAAETWAREWAAVSASDGIDVLWEDRSWHRLGRQRVPVRITLHDPDAVARFAGGRAEKDWSRLRDRLASVRDVLGPSEALDQALRRHATEIQGWPLQRFQEVVDVTSWLVRHPVVGLRPRQIPVRGVDSKWLKGHRGVVTALHAATTGRADLGLIDADPLVRSRLLDPSLAVGGLNDLAAPASQLATLDLRPDVVFIFENLESVLAMPAWPGAVVVHGSGYAIDVAGELPWVARAPVVYWGDLDSHGFAIVHRLRHHHGRVTTALMDEATLLLHRDLWVPELKPARGTYPTLTESEQATLLRIRAEGDVRLEQERIPWGHALAELEVAARSATS